ncbi:glycoside hydrolase family 3 N-terminal domain-containing protein [Paenibacillus sinopodophylli]|uniref:glycoside hydrolase family 3 N-terminal domain-containing protein n=1 Tax=Paenibacillus sinopodophylli TaxID=1837342 RepID=UPI0024831BDD|nr:glycoside hydrolase family 3 N-terminal domain-containing protein [Paenibacillus sinopodophylli]
MNVEEKVAQMNCIMAAIGNFTNMEGDLGNGIGQIGTLTGCFTPDMNADMVEKVQKYLLENTRLGIPALFHVETLNGAISAGATNYPFAIGLGATWHPEAVAKMADEIRMEMLAIGHRQALAPVLDVSRDPRWGRVGETYGESPTLCSEMGVAYVNALQTNDLKQGMAACAKHFVGYAVTDGGLNKAATHLAPRELREVYAKPFEAVIRKANIAGVMNSYSSIDGEPVIASKAVQKDLLRDELGFTGTTISDYSSIDKLCSTYGTASNVTEAGLQALKAGMDCETPSIVCYGSNFVEAVKVDSAALALVDEAVYRILWLKFSLGLFENPYPDREAMKTRMQSAEAKETAYRLACESMVLLKNEGNQLPLQNAKKVAVIGPNADSARVMFATYSYPAFHEMMLDKIRDQNTTGGQEGVQLAPEMEATLAWMPSVEKVIAMNYPGIQTVFEAIDEALPGCEVRYAQGCDIMGKKTEGFDEAVGLAEKSDVVIMVLGGQNGSGNSCSMGENVDTSDIGLPGVQEQLLRAVFTTGTPVVLVHMNGRPLSSVWAAENIPSIIEAWHPGQMGAKAVADTLTGKSNPGGKLPITALRNAGQIPIYAEQPHGSGPFGRGDSTAYVNEVAGPLYPFGHGLSYTSFEVSDLNLSTEEITPDGDVKITCTVTNTGTVVGDEVVQLYFTDRLSSMVRPQKELAGFKRVTLAPGESQKIRLTLYASQTAFLNRQMKWMVEAGVIDVMIGSSSDNPTLTSSFCITDTVCLEYGQREFYAEARIV